MKVENIKYKEKSETGCETCDYGSEYITNIKFEVDGYKVEIETNKMYNFALTKADYMQLFNQCKNLDHFYERMFDKIADLCWKGQVDRYVGLEAFEMKINGEYIDIVQSCLHGEPIKLKGDENGKV